MKNCHVPDNGKEGGWDVIYKNQDGIKLPDGDIVHTVYVEMKNKHNTMNSSAAGKTYIKMQNQLLKDDDCACFLVEAIAKESQNIKWCTTVDNSKVSHKRIRRVSLDQFYALITGEEDAFFQICMTLPNVISEVSKRSSKVKVPKDTVVDEIKSIADKIVMDDKDVSMATAIYLLGFSSYNGFASCIDEGRLKNAKGLGLLYEYAKKLS